MTAPVEIREVTKPRDWRDFHGIKDRIERGDPARVRLLNFQRRLPLDVKRNPFYQHADRIALAAYRGREIVGRICAIDDRLHRETHGDRTGFFGFFESIDDPSVAGCLLDAASSWLRGRGCDALRGPVNPSMKNDFGVVVFGHERPPYVMTPHTPPYYAGLLEHNGLQIIRTFLAYDLDASVDRTQFGERWRGYAQLAQRIAERYPEIQVHTADPNDMEREIRRINALGDRVRSSGWGFVPFTPAELDFVVSQLQRVLRPEMVHVATCGEQLIGYLMAMPDLNDALRHSYGPWDWLRLPQVAWGLRRKRRLRIFGVGIDPAYRHTGLLGLLIMHLYRDQGDYREWEFSWIDSTNTRSIAAVNRFVPLTVSKRYHLYQRPIELAKGSP